jgi:kinesin family protein 1
MVNGRRLEPGKVSFSRNLTSIPLLMFLRLFQPKQLRSGYRLIMGDFHVFRFKWVVELSRLFGSGDSDILSSNPEEVRKARDKVRASVQEGVHSPAPNGTPDGMTPPPTRPDSPLSTMSAVVEGADWAYARREAVIARLNGTDVDLDKIGDDDLERLYADIHKARTMRKGTSMGRPESRMSSYLESVDERDDDEEDGTSSASPSLRPFSGSTYTTDDTSLGSTLTLNGAHAEVDVRLKQVKDEMETQLEAQRVEYEEKLQAMTQASADTGDIKSEKAQMEAKLQLVQAEMEVRDSTEGPITYDR